MADYFPKPNLYKFNYTLYKSLDIIERRAKTIKEIISSTSGITKDKKGNLSLKGSRPENMKYYIDGIPIIGKPNIPTSAIETIEIYNNGTPAKF